MPYKNPADKRRRENARYREKPEYYQNKTTRHRNQNPEKHAYWGQRHTSKQRGVEFNLTFEEFVEFWGDDFERRGRGKKDLCMCRYGDTGAYEVGNIYKDTNAGNKQGPRYKGDLNV